MFGRFGPWELILILIIALVIFGPSKLPELGRSLGKGLKEFKGATKELKDSIEDDDEDSNNDSTTNQDKPEEEK